MKNKYDHRYFNAPPDLPGLFYKHPRYGKNAVVDLIAWAEKEYNDALRLFAKRKAYNTVRCLSNEYSGMRILAEFPEFQRIASLITQDVWNQLTGRQRVYLRRAYEMRSTLGATD